MYCRVNVYSRIHKAELDKLGLVGFILVRYVRVVHYLELATCGSAAAEANDSVASATDADAADTEDVAALGGAAETAALCMAVTAATGIGAAMAVGVGTQHALAAQLGRAQIGSWHHSLPPPAPEAFSVRQTASSLHGGVLERELIRPSTPENHAAENAHRIVQRERESEERMGGPSYLAWLTA
jgi:hypothetical protein